MDAQIKKLEQRKYLRIHITFPVRFQHLNVNGKPEGEIFQGFTRNVSKGGMFIESRLDKKAKLCEFIPDKTKLKLIINIPPDSAPIDSTAIVKWAGRVSEPAFDTCFFGVKYDQIDNAQHRMIERYIKRLHHKPKIFLYFFLLFTALTIAFTYFILVKP